MESQKEHVCITLEELRRAGEKDWDVKMRTLKIARDKALDCIVCKSVYGDYLTLRKYYACRKS